MKNIIIGGASRSGKSTIAKAVAKKLNISYIPFDSIVSTIGDCFPGHSVRHCDDTLSNSKEVATCFKVFLSHLNYEGMPYIIDTYQIKPEDLLQAIDPKDYTVVYIGYPTITLEDKIKAVRVGARPEDWTEALSDQELAPIIDGFIQDSIVLYDQCHAHGIPFVDTTEDFEGSMAYCMEYLCQGVSHHA